MEVLESVSAAISLSSTNVWGLSQNHSSVHKRTKSGALARGFCQKKCNIFTNSSGKVFHGASASDSADLVNDISKVDRPIKRNSRKRGKRRGKQHRKPPLCSTDGATALDEVICGTSIFESCSSKATFCGNENIVSNSFPESAEVCSISPELSATRTSASCCGEEDESETQASLSQCFSGNDFSQLCLSGRHHNQVNSESMIYTSDAILSNFDGEVADGNQKQCSIRDDSSPGILSDEYGPPILDSFSDCSDSDGSLQGGDNIDIQTCNEGGTRVDLFDSRRILDYSSYGTSLHDTRNTEEIFIHRTPCNSSNEWSNGNSPQSKVVDDNYTYISRGGGHECGSSDILSAKKGRRGRKLPGSMSGVRGPSSSGNMHGRAGKENGHSVWQKVQKDDLGECAFDPKNIHPVRSHSNGAQEVPSCVRHNTFVCPWKSGHGISTRSTCLEETCGQADVLEGSAGVFGSDVSSLKSEHDNLRNRDSEKLKRKPYSGLKEENQNSRKGPHSGKSNLIRCSKINMQQKKALENPKPVIYNKSFGAGLRSPYADNQRLGTSLTNRVNWRPAEPLQNAQIHLEETKLLGPVCTVVSDMAAQAAHNLISPLSKTSDALAQTHVLKVDSEINSKFHKDLPGFPFLPMSNEVNESAKLEIDFPQAEHGKQDHSSASISQKWVPVGRKYFMLDTCRSEKLSTNHLEEAAPDGWDPKKIPEDSLSSNSPCLVSLTKATVACPGLDSGSLNLRSPVDGGQADNFRHHAAPSMHIKHSSTHSVTNHHSTLEDNNGRISFFETNANEIAQVVNDAHRLQIESEKIQLATGNPLAEFERFLHSASPVVAQAFGFQNCHTCKGDWPIGNSLCRHQIPNISLASIWQWYEGPGSYGLEVKAEDYRNSKRMGRDRFEFRAYFVPSLSAVQFFSHSRSSMCCSSDDKPNTDLETTSHNSSHLDKVFSILIPRPRGGENTSVSLPMTSWSPSFSSATSVRDEHCTPFAQACYDDSELLFEYFESEQPQQRQPLFEKIKELVRGSTTPYRQIYGDPSKLDCLRLHDLHPSSWYSVAWYPIYQIPDGNLRAAFLTYHSLAHFIHRSSSLELGGATCVVSPAVGLQSYNAQGECWFQQRNSMIQTENPCFNPSEILRERLRALEQTAAVMARASVRKGDQKSINRQPDYEFFLSRRR